MSWKIHLVRNTLTVSLACARDLYNSNANVADCWRGDRENATDKQLRGLVFDGLGRLVFDPDHMEHMDYLWDQDVQEILRRHRAEGEVCFSSNEGDNAGQDWGYRFDGRGGMRRLRGVLRWEEVPPAYAVRNSAGYVADADETPEPTTDYDGHALRFDSEADALEWIGRHPAEAGEDPRPVQVG